MKPVIDILVPIYRGLEETRRCIQSVVDNQQQSACELILINDASPEPEIHEFLKIFSARHQHTVLLENEQNLGFVATVNRGMALNPTHDVILLNSDTEVANDWLDRISAAAYSDARIATVTPFSTNATICSFPLFCKANPMPNNWSLAELDQLFAEVNTGQVVEIPTAVGFCQFIKRDCLKQIGGLDVKRFGKGYGEENDFCRRAAHKGWLHVLCCDTFVFHEGGVSFSTEQEARVNKAQEILDRMYPDYHALVQQHIEEDPAEIYRIRAMLEMLHRSPRHKILFITHHLGGGTKKHIAELGAYLQHEMDALVIRPVEDGCITLFLGGIDNAPHIQFSLPDAYPDLLLLLRYVGISRLHFHHTLSLETSVWGLPHDLGVPFDITLHDYYFINANPTQTDAKGVFSRDLNVQVSSYPLPVSLKEWQDNQSQLLEAANRVIAPSGYMEKLFIEHFPHIDYTVVYHPDSELDMPYPDLQQPRKGEHALRVLVIGALSLEKGADILESTAQAAQKLSASIEFHLLGYAYRPLASAVHEHGAYDETQIESLIMELAPDLVWFPALWPETYSYTLSEVMRTGLPIVVPNLGAFPERVVNRPLTWVVDWDQSPENWCALFERCRKSLKTAAAGSTDLHWRNQYLPPDSSGFYKKRYLPKADYKVVNKDMEINMEWLGRVLDGSREKHLAVSALTRKEELLLRLVDMRQGVMGRLVSRFVPMGIQRSLKRTLSRKPLHELKR